MTVEQAQPNAEVQPTDDQDRVAGEGLEAPVNLTQGALNSLIANEIRKDRRKFAEKYGDPDELLQAKAELDKRRNDELTEMEKLQRAIAEKDAEIARVKQEADAERLNALRLRVGQEMGLPAVLSARLQGADEEAIREDATAMKAVMGQGSPLHIPSIEATAGGEQTGGKSPAKLTPSQKAAARVANMTDEAYAELLREMQGE